ncbi:phosphatase [Nocardia crassostreae]|uniref:phosphatase n=1 Tax=Nocardia crassostreae TaxID=53428 RepID=UPI0009FE9461|nr:phosphatase [Nocardia crassostreae]
MAPNREQLVAHLLATRMAGRVATPRENNLEHYARMARRDPHYQFGLDLGMWTPDTVLDLMVRKVGVDPRLNYRRGVDTIDPELTADALDRYAARFAKAVQARQRVLFATGHPRTLARLYQRLAAALIEAGGTVAPVGDGLGYDAENRYGMVRRVEVESFLNVGILADGGVPIHTHSPRPIQLVLADLTRRGEPLPDLVVADRGWCGRAAQSGLDAIGFADCNDPALFAGEDEGTVAVAVPLDDGIDEDQYDLLGEYILAQG